MGKSQHSMAKLSQFDDQSAGDLGQYQSQFIPKCASADNPVDLVHLSRQSLGDRSLENEILRLFHSQSTLYLDRLANATTADERRFAAHTVVGSARGIGAWKVAEQAKAVEMASSRKCDISGLRIAIEDANSYIESLLNDYS